MEIWDTPIYNPVYVSQLIDLSTGRIKRWLQGYAFTYKSGSSGEKVMSNKAPVIGRDDSNLYGVSSPKLCFELIVNFALIPR